jgi:glycosyltransferase involved in cell wall biosynthesis
VLDGLARGLESAGHEVVLFATGDSTCPVVTSWVHERAIWLDQANITAELHQVIAGYAELAGCDVVHDHTLAGPLYAARFPELPVVTTNHGPFDRAAVLLYRAIAERVPVVAISRHQASTGAGVPIARVIHHGVDVAAFPPGTGGGGYALFLGRMTPDKGIDTAIRVARAAGAPLVIAAKMREGPEVAYFRQHIEPMLGASIEYVGEVGGAEKLELLAGARCLLNPIRWPEPFGLVMIEALACGTPVITMAHGAAPEIVDHGVTGFLCHDYAQLAGALAGVASIDRSTCRAIAKERFSSDRMVAEHLELYREVVERPSRGLLTDPVVGINVK